MEDPLCRDSKGVRGGAGDFLGPNAYGHGFKIAVAAEEAAGHRHHAPRVIAHASDDVVERNGRS